MKIDDQIIDKISGLAHLEFGDEGKEKIRQDLEQILTFVERLNELETENVEPLVYLSDKSEVLRADSMKQTISIDEAMLNAPEKSGRFFMVPQVIRK
jgi:aspartyl-tRNA(Asn)/glutamyl-tRNA(Gln) amidotransferase subunit C